VIANERQYRITKAELRRFEEAIEVQRKSPPSEGVHPRIHRAIGDSLRSEAVELRGQLQCYEDLRDGRITHREIDGLRELPVALIEARIAARMTQKDLAESLGLKPQQVQKWEATLYSGVGLERLQDIIDAVGMQVQEQISYAVST
jgi:DNA-binding Xre family transcriptional regulator